MRQTRRLGFVVRDDEVRNDILVPPYYDPEIDELLERLRGTHELIPISELVHNGALELRQGKYIAKSHYGTGQIPYVRTSDLANWEIRASPKHGVALAVWQTYQAQQDVQPGDVLLVHEGTYLIGTSAVVTPFDLPLLFQHHLAKIRALPESGLTGPLLCALLSSQVVQRQVRAKQLTADIIDSIVGRLEEVVLPIPRDDARRVRLAAVCAAAFYKRAEARSRLSHLVRCVDRALRGEAADVDSVLKVKLGQVSPMALLGERIGFRAFPHPSGGVLDDILIPAYYDPTIATSLAALRRAGCELESIGSLQRAGVLSLETGHEVGKLAYGSGAIPFVRTSDLGSWELKLDPKQRVSRAVYDSLAGKQSASDNDILVVRDGTYLVGSAAMVSTADVPLLFSGGIYRVRVERPDELSPYLLMVLLWSEIVRRQIRAKRFTRDVIDTLGRRFEEVVIPIPPEPLRTKITAVARQLIEQRTQLRAVAGRLGSAVEASEIDDLEDWNSVEPDFPAIGVRSAEP